MPVQAVEEGLYTYLAAGTALTDTLGGTNIWNKLAPPTPPSNYVIFQFQGGGEQLLSPSRSRDVLFLIKGVSKNPDTAHDIDTQIDARMNSSNFSITGYNTYWVYRETDVSFVELPDDREPLYHQGAIYRIRYEES